MTLLQVSEVFDEHLVSYDEFALDPGALLADERLLACVGDLIYTYKDAQQIMMGQLAFGRVLPPELAPRSLSSFASDFLQVQQILEEELGEQTSSKVVESEPTT
mmetsp:Transcript_15334/g.25918  ORF Transcript_15334/g.25918 Transcript_15334/m.25918 type:complete len:104 (+) Transcript_15334:94-405(+)